MVTCPYCESNLNHQKRGFRIQLGIKVQRYYCKDCQTMFIENPSPKGATRTQFECENCPNKKAFSKNLCQACYRRKRREEGKDK